MIEGASEGAGLGIRFLKHLTRTRLLLHIVDMAPFDGSDPAEAVQSIVSELARFSPTLHGRDRWLVLNKMDLLPEDQRQQLCQQVVEALDWQGPVYSIAAINKQGVEPICRDIMAYLESCREQELEDPELALEEAATQSKMQEESRLRIQELAAVRKAARALQLEQNSDDDDWDDDDHDVEVVYEP